MVVLFCGNFKLHTTPELRIEHILKSRRRGWVAGPNFDWKVAVTKRTFSKMDVSSSKIEKFREIDFFIQEVSHPLAKEIVSIVTSLSPLQVTFAWIPNHRDIIGNEKADEITKQAATLSPIANDLLTASDLKTFFKYWHQQQWKENCEKTSNFNKLGCIKISTDPWSTSSRANQREEISLRR